MIRFKNIRFNRSIQVMATKSDWWNSEDMPVEIWMDDDQLVWLRFKGFTKLVSGVPYDAEVFQEDVPKSPSELKAKKPSAAKTAPEPAA